MHAFGLLLPVSQDIFYEKADALVGVCRDLDMGCSKTISFDLSRFEDPLPDS
jgi:structural maintenance of chromosome 1